MGSVFMELGLKYYKSICKFTFRQKFAQKNSEISWNISRLGVSYGLDVCFNFPLFAVIQDLPQKNN